MKLTLRKETLAELSTEELAELVAGRQEPTPPYYSSQLRCISEKLTVLNCYQPTPPYTTNCPN